MTTHVRAAPAATSERVLPTLNQDGTRRWLRPRLSRGPWLSRRFAVAWGLMLAFILLPHVQVGGKPAMLLDIVHREFTFFGRTFLASDGILLMLLMIGIFASVFLITGLVGRAWCGWGCPQTVYLEFVFRPLERLIEGPISEQRRMDRGALTARRALKLAAYLVIATFLAHAFLAYFVGWDDLLRWMQLSPLEHPAPFLVMLVTTALVMADFAWFREQACLVACPYGRFQATLLDEDSLIVGYDTKRGEPRTRPARAKAGAPAGDCIDCVACVSTCPTGIDIRDGLQMECVGCTQCIDACDAIMDRMKRPRGLIRYTSRAVLAGGKRRILRPRIVAYAAIVTLAFGGLAWRIVSAASADVTVLRRVGAPFTAMADGRVSNLVRVKIVNRGKEARRYRLALGDPGVTLEAPQNPVSIAGGAESITPVFVMAPRASFTRGQRPVTIIVKDDAEFSEELPYTLLGP